eukprot:2175185-Pleurochrysis_carterae.AAC.5
MGNGAAVRCTAVVQAPELGQGLAHALVTPPLSGAIMCSVKKYEFDMSALRRAEIEPKCMPSADLRTFDLPKFYIRAKLLKNVSILVLTTGI